MNIKTTLSPDSEESLYVRVRDLVVTARQTVARGVDLVQVRTNFEIGRHIVEFEQQGADRAAYGDALIRNLTIRLTYEFGQGFSLSNLKSMRQFFLLYCDRIGPRSQIGQTVSGLFEMQKSQTLSGRLTNAAEQQAPSERRTFTLSWSHYVFLLGVKNPDERSFYEIEATGQGWTLRELKRQFDSSLFERLALSRDQAGIRQLAAQGQIVNQPKDLLKEPLVLEFLGLAEQARYSESDLEAAIVSQVEHFLLELGKGCPPAWMRAMCATSC